MQLLHKNGVNIDKTLYWHVMRPMSVGKCISEDGSQRPGPVVTACSAGGYRLKAAGCNGLPSVRPHQAGSLNGCFLRLG
ncbi:hypothetical protein T01_816 [Trichinella spiralis]|uniref:Uncharacterized protein n=1 Tax=Trichinella spiralis TaxID=6334 RepID=A0A0V1BK64_TRISP|nr:hypothetical protein T01_816 [Trichinella spiralis]